MPNRIKQLQTVDAVLTNLARGYTPSGFIASLLFPTVLADKEQGVMPSFGKEAFQVRNTLRAVRGSSNIITPDDVSTITYSMDEHDAVYPVDYREVTAAKKVFSMKKYAMTVAMNSILMKKESLAATLATTAATYASSNKVTLSGTTQWTHASGTPLTDIATAMEAVRQAIGKYPNVCCMGAQSWKAFRVNAQVLARFTTANRIAMLADFEALTGIAKVGIGTVPSAAAGSSPSTMTDLWGDYCILAYVPEIPDGEMTPAEPTYGATLALEDFPVVDSWTEQGGKIENVRATGIFKSAILGADAGYLIIDTNA